MALRIGLVGLGNMGRPISSRLAECGRRLLVFDKDAARAAEVGKAGADVAASLEEIAQGCDVVLLSLPTPAVVRSVVGALLQHMPVGNVILDFSTNDAATAMEMGKAAAQRGLCYVDAPVSGGPSRAATGELTTMVGGDDAAVQRIRPILQQIAREVEHVGPSGSGGIAKLLNNFVAIWNMVGVSEAFLAASALNIPSERLYAVMSKSSGRSYSLDRNYPKIRDGDFKANFAAELAEKDFRLALDLIASTGVTAVADRELRSLFETTAREHGQSDVAAIHQVLRNPDRSAGA